MNRKIITGTIVTFIGLVAVLNISEPLSNKVCSTPVVGDLLRNIVLREIRKDKEPVNISIRKYEVDGVSETTQVQIERKISDKLNSWIEDTRKMYLVEKVKHIELGNSANTYIKKNLEFRVYVPLATESRLSFFINIYDKDEDKVVDKRAYNLDIENNRSITLLDLLGPEYKKKVSQGIDDYVQKCSVNNKELLKYYETYYKSKNIDYNEDTVFYMNKAGNIILTFDERELLPRDKGVRRVEIPVSESNV